MILISVACVGLTGESILMSWEFWVSPLIIIGTVFLWVMNISGKPEYKIRRVCYLVFGMLAVLYHGVHETSIFDAAIVMALLMVGYASLNQLYMQHLFLFEYMIILILQIGMALESGSTVFNPLNISRVFLHIAMIFLIYVCCIKAIVNRVGDAEAKKEKDERIEAYDADMEDFLSNISHELRTPVNVVNGMSDLLIKKNAGSEAFSIKEAGIRLSYQIEDIQDYTECKRNKLLIEEEEYTSISLINDVVSSFRKIDDERKLELVVDLAPDVPAKMSGDIKKLHKIFRYLTQNAVKFTKQGGILVKMNTEKMDYGVNLCIEITDTGIGMDRKAIAAVSQGMYQVNKKRNRSSGGIGLGLFIAYGFVHAMGGFIKIESEKGIGTTVRVTVPQQVTDETACLELTKKHPGDIIFHVRSDKYKVPQVRDFYRNMAVNLASSIRVPLYPAESVEEIERLKERLYVNYIFMGQEEYEENPAYFDELAKSDMVIAVSAAAGFKPTEGSEVIVMPKPFYAYPVINVINEGKNARNIQLLETGVKPSFEGVKALVVDDEPMNLVVAAGLFSDYGMSVDTSLSGKEAVNKYRDGDYDIVFMDHMMPEMDGVEAMKRIKKVADETGRSVVVIVLTANVVSGAKEMFAREGFDGFLSKPIYTKDYERIVSQLLSVRSAGREGDMA